MFKRNITEKLENDLLRSPVILLTGARQTGKTTLIKHIAKIKNYNYITFDDIISLSAAKNDPIGFINGIKKPVILDEVQRAPELFLSIKKDVDEVRIPGRYLLTGSANPLLIPRLGDSLAGRMEILNLFPLSQGEIIGKKDRFIDFCFNDDFQNISTNLDFENIYKRINIGGYPLVQDYDLAGRESWFDSYITTILQRDIKEISQISGLYELPQLLKLLATRVANLTNISELSRIIGIPSNTLNRYVILLESIFLINFQLSWSSNLGKRLIKSTKTFLIDTGLLTFLLGINLENELKDKTILGPIVENFVFSELLKQSTWSKSRVKLYYYRTVSGIEVDFVIENSAGEIVCIEVKNSSTVIAKDFKGLQYIKDEIGQKFIKGIVLYNGTQITPFAKDLFAIPITSLWQI